MTILYLEAGNEKVAPVSPFPSLTFNPLYHQLRTLEALRRHDLVINTYNTGTGKTRASLLYLFDLHEANARRQRGAPRQNVLFVAPTNALLTQHTEDIQAFVAENALNFEVHKITAQDITDLESGLRKGETLQRFVQNPLEFDPDAVRPRPFVVVVNPDIYYYAMFFRYGPHDRRNVFGQFLRQFNYIVIDEFHYYDSKQLANFLFLFALFDVFRYFDEGRKVCLLSATPAPKVLLYLERLFGAQGERWVIVAKENEPPESAGYATLPTLTPLELTVSADEVQDWVTARRGDLAHRVMEDGLDGAVISSALWRVNVMYHGLLGFLSEDQMGRITGPETQEARVAATGKSLILASPTVDIGYSFKKLGKARQNVDFLICDARFSDGLLQRIGRAGRVLGKPTTDHPSCAMAFLPEEAARALAAYDGQTLSRAAFKALVMQLRADGLLPEKHNLYAYVHSHAITECFWPIYQLNQMMTGEDRDILERLYRRVVEVFAPNSTRTQRSLDWFFTQYDRRERWLGAAKKSPGQPPSYTAHRIADWVAWIQPERGEMSARTIEAKVDIKKMWGNVGRREELISFVAGQVALTKALFSFRDSFQGPTAVAYDPMGLLSGETVNVYDLFHLLSNYELDLLDKRRFKKLCGQTGLEGDFYVKLNGFREERRVVMFSYPTDMARREFEARHCCGEALALTGLRIVIKAHGGDVIQTDDAIVKAMATQYIAALVVMEEDSGAASKLGRAGLWSRELTVHFPDVTRTYRAFMGTAAFHAQAELYGYFKYKARQQALEKLEAYII